MQNHLEAFNFDVGHCDEFERVFKLECGGRIQTTAVVIREVQWTFHMISLLQ